MKLVALIILVLSIGASHAQPRNPCDGITPDMIMDAVNADWGQKGVFAEAISGPVPWFPACYAWVHAFIPKTGYHGTQKIAVSTTPTVWQARPSNGLYIWTVGNYN